jgi:hypothetical protein
MYTGAELTQRCRQQGWTYLLNVYHQYYASARNSMPTLLNLSFPYLSPISISPTPFQNLRCYGTGTVWAVTVIKWNQKSSHRQSDTVKNCIFDFFHFFFHILQWIWWNLSIFFPCKEAYYVFRPDFFQHFFENSAFNGLDMEQEP